MVLSPATAKTHVSRAMIKLGARDRAQLVVFAYQSGLVAPRAAGQAPGPLTSLSLPANPGKPAGRGPGRLAAGSCRSGLEIRIRNPDRRRALVSWSETRRGVPQAGHPSLGVVALGDDSGEAPTDASQWTPHALRHVVVHRSSSFSGHLIAGHH